MYNTYYLTTFTLNTSGGATATTEAMTKEVDGQIVPCTKAEAELKMANKLSSVGGNKATQSIKCYLFDEGAYPVKVDEIKKE